MVTQLLVEINVIPHSPLPHVPSDRSPRPSHIDTSPICATTLHPSYLFNCTGSCNKNDECLYTTYDFRYQLMRLFLLNLCQLMTYVFCCGTIWNLCCFSLNNSNSSTFYNIDTLRSNINQVFNFYLDIVLCLFLLLVVEFFCINDFLIVIKFKNINICFKC